MVTSEKPKDSKGTNVSSENSNVRESKNGIQNSSEIPVDVPLGGDSSSNGYDVGRFGVALNKPPTFMGIDGLKSLRLTARVISFIPLPDQQIDTKISLSMEADTIDGARYILNEKYLEYREIEYYFIDDCLSFAKMNCGHW